MKGAQWEYRKTQLLTATPAELILITYDIILQTLNEARSAMENKDYEGKNKLLIRAQGLLSELQQALNFEEGGEIAKNLGALYSFCYRRLVEANVRNNTSIVEEVERILKGLYEAWQKIVEEKPKEAEGGEGVTFTA